VDLIKLQDIPSPSSMCQASMSNPSTQ